MTNNAVLVRLPTVASGNFININDFSIPLLRVSNEVCQLLFRTASGSGTNPLKIINGEGYFTDINGETNLGSSVEVNASDANTTVYYRVTSSSATLVLGNSRNIIKIGDQNVPASLLGSGGAILNRFDVVNLLNLPLLTYFGARSSNSSTTQLVGDVSLLKDTLIKDWILGTSTRQSELVGNIKDIIKRDTSFVQIYANGIKGTFKDLYDAWNSRPSSPITIIHSDGFTGNIADIKALAQLGQLQVSSKNITVDLNDLPRVGELLSINNNGTARFTGTSSSLFYTTRSFNVFSYIENRTEIDNLILALANSPSVGSGTSASKNLILRGNTSYLDDTSPNQGAIRAAVEVLALRGMTINISNT